MQALPKNWMRRSRHHAAVFLLVLLAACGGGKETEGEQVAELPVAERPAAADAARFLTQASFGPRQADIDWVNLHGYAAWLQVQMAQPQNPHRSYIDAVTASYAGTDSKVSQTHFRESFWTQALSGPDQLRQRATFALSQVFVLSFLDGNLSGNIRGVTTYYDMLGAHAFGNYRDLLEAVTLHPMMGFYLTSVRNQKEDGKGRVPDENYAREVMQLFSIGLYELNNDGSYKGGTPVETYTHDDIQGLAKVFTGFSFYAGPNVADRTDRRFFGNDANADRDWQPMQAYNKFHSVSEKKFLGVTIPAVPQPDPKVAPVADAEGDLQIALDRLFNHPNVGPFLGRQLIQRLVTSNPSPAYIGRVASAFNDNGSGVRGDMKAVFKAILLDPEARTYNAKSTTYGKVREPILRLSATLRALDSRSISGHFSGIDDTDSIAGGLGQTVLRAPSVFNFYRPGYVPPNSAAAAAGLVAPEFQNTNEVSVAGYLNYMKDKWVRAAPTRDIQPDLTPLLPLVEDVPALVDRMNLLLMSGQMTTALQDQITAAVQGRAIPVGNGKNQADIDTAKSDRVRIALMLTIASPDFLIQK